jgi:hypothetical protein
MKKDQQVEGGREGGWGIGRERAGNSVGSSGNNQW